MLVAAIFTGCKQKPGEGEKAEKNNEEKKPELISKWNTDSVFKIPESVCYDSSGDVLYVSNIQGNPTEKDAAGFISKVSTGGEILKLKWAVGMDAPKGMGIKGDKLYVTNVDEIVEIDINDHAITGRFPCEDSKFMNDIAINGKGTVFASDMATGVIYRLKEGKAEKWIESEALKSPNGLFTEKNQLLIGMKGKVMKADYLTGDLTEYISNTGGIDGLEKVKEGVYIKSDWTGHVHLLYPDKEKELILNTAADKINAADIEFVPGKNMLYVPTFNDNRVMAYKLIF